MNEKTILLSLTYVVGFSELILAGFFWMTNSKNEVRKVMAFLALSTGIWVIFNAITSYTNPSTFITFALALDHAFGIIIVTTLLYLCLIFPYRIWNIDRMHVFLLYVPSIIFSLLSIFTKTLVSGYMINPEIPGKVIVGPIYNIYNLFIVIFFASSLILLFIRSKKSGGIHKKNILLLFWSVILGGLPAVVFNVFQFQYFLLSTIFSLFWLAGITYIVLKK